jgi:hypothetical protein
VRRRSARGLLASLALAAASTSAPASAAQTHEASPSSPPASSPAEPSTRAERWRRLREEKRERLVPPRVPWLERKILQIEKAERPSLMQLNLFGLYPRGANVARGSQVAGGVRLWHPDIGTSPVDVHASGFLSLDRYEFFDAQVGLLPHRPRQFPKRSNRDDDVHELGDVRRGFASRAVAYAAARYEHWPETPFYGLGPDPPTQRTSYLFQQATYEAVGGYEFGPRLSVELRGGLRQVFVGPGREPPSSTLVFSEEEAAGITRQPDFLHWSATVMLDSRDEPGNAHRGAMLAVGWEAYDDIDSSSYRFQRFAADARAFVPLGSPQRVLALRARVSADRPADGQAVPFYFQETLGGGHDLRAFRTFRFRGEKVVVGHAEYRWEAWPAVELAAFVDAGRVFAPGEALSIEELEHDWGFGIRFKSFDATLLRVDAAFGREGTRVAARVGASF